MTKTAAVGDGPVSFSTQQGTQIEVPLSDIYFENGTIKTTRNDAGLGVWLTFLANQGRLTAGVTPPAATSLQLTAAVSGSQGNGILVTVDPVTPATNPATSNMAVTETDRYDGLTLKTLAESLGKQNGPRGTNPGLLVVKDIPNNLAGLALVDGAIQATGQQQALSWTIASAGQAGQDVVTLVPRDPAIAPANIKVNIHVTDPVGGAFTLTAEWSNVGAEITLTDGTDPDFENVNPPIDPIVSCTIQGQGPFKLPRPGSVTLAGGSNPVAATAMLLADD